MRARRDGSRRDDRAARRRRSSPRTSPRSPRSRRPAGTSCSSPVARRAGWRRSSRPPVTAASRSARNGAFVYDLHTERVLESFLLEAPTPRSRSSAGCATLMPDVQFAIETAATCSRASPATTRAGRRPTGTASRRRGAVDQPVAKLLARDDTSLGDAMLALAAPALGDLATVTHSNPSDGLLEISAPGVSKASTLARLCARARRRRRRRRRVRRPAQRPADARVRGRGVRRRERAPRGARRGRRTTPRRSTTTASRSCSRNCSPR